MVCSFCGMVGHNVTNCEVKITARARCIFDNDYDPIFHADDPLNRKYWWKRIIIKNVDEYGESWWYENQISQTVLPMVQVEVEENVEAYKHIGYSIDNNQDLPDVWREKMNNIFGMFNDSLTSLNVISVNSRDWKPLPKAWFSRNHNAGLKSCFENRDDSLQARYRVLMRLKELHEEQYPEGSRPNYIESNNVGAHYIESNNVGAGEPAYGESDIDSDGDTIIIVPPAIRTDQVRNPGEMPDLRRPDLQIETPSDTQPTNVTVSDSTTCGICWDELGDANVMVTKCGHKFCCDCILSHFQNAAGTNCPLCREEYAKRVQGWLPPVVEEERPTRRRGRPRRSRQQWTEEPYTPPTYEGVPNVVESIPNIPINNLIHDLGTTEGATAIGNAIIEALRTINSTRV